jgi:hypothetical protein
LVLSDYVSHDVSNKFKVATKGGRQIKNRHASNPFCQVSLVLRRWLREQRN